MLGNERWTHCCSKYRGREFLLRVKNRGPRIYQVSGFKGVGL
jgi:hypothetical protein